VMDHGRPDQGEAQTQGMGELLRQDKRCLHPGDEEITVLSGTLYFGHGLTMEPEKTMTLPAGSFIAEPAKSWHYLLTKSEPVEVEIRGIGPRANIFAQ
jgi:hypothetical protein